jgi:hypothetical protein
MSALFSAVFIAVSKNSYFSLEYVNYVNSFQAMIFEASLFSLFIPSIFSILLFQKLAKGYKEKKILKELKDEVTWEKQKVIRFHSLNAPYHIFIRNLKWFPFCFLVSLCFLSFLMLIMPFVPFVPIRLSLNYTSKFCSGDAERMNFLGNVIHYKKVDCESNKVKVKTKTRKQPLFPPQSSQMIDKNDVKNDLNEGDVTVTIKKNESRISGENKVYYTGTIPLKDLEDILEEEKIKLETILNVPLGKVKIYLDTKKERCVKGDAVACYFHNRIFIVPREMASKEYYRRLIRHELIHHVEEKIAEKYEVQDVKFI